MSFLAVCQRSLRTNVKYCLKLTNQMKVAKERCLVIQQLYLPQICAGYATKGQPGFGHESQILPYPNIETIRSFAAESFREHNFQKVKYGDYVFKECAEGFIHVFVQGYQHPRNTDEAVGYAVSFGENHPLNASGPVERRQTLKHSKLYGFLKAIHLIPKNLKIQKVCVCLDEMQLIGFVAEGIPRLSENSFRTESGNFNKDHETTMEINNLLRSRQDITTLRMRYVPNLISISEMRQAKKMATKASIEATKLLNIKRY